MISSAMICSARRRISASVSGGLVLIRGLANYLGSVALGVCLCIDGLLQYGKQEKKADHFNHESSRSGDRFNDRRTSLSKF